VGIKPGFWAPVEFHKNLAMKINRQTKQARMRERKSKRRRDIKSDITFTLSTFNWHPIAKPRT